MTSLVNDVLPGCLLFVVVLLFVLLRRFRVYCGFPVIRLSEIILSLFGCTEILLFLTSYHQLTQKFFSSNFAFDGIHVLNGTVIAPSSVLNSTVFLFNLFILYTD